ncbi:MAG TPA: hypothetical protein VFJ47_09530 [Terriglobales bacterium]|nr:hypothetical protein [Terriglobales bacterium]
MLRITIREQADSTAICLEGRLVGPWVEELKLCWQRTLAQSAGKKLRAELDAVTFVDAAGKQLLREMHQSGAELKGRGVLTSYWLNQIEHCCLDAAEPASPND